MRMLNDRGLELSMEADRQMIKDIKESLTFVAQDFDQMMEENQVERHYELSNGRVIKLGVELFRCPEALFKPALLGDDWHELDGVDKVLFKSVMKCDADIREDMFQNVVLAGGNSMFEGLDERLRTELNVMVAPGKVKLMAPPERSNSVWIGGSIITSLSANRKIWATKQEYDEVGPSIMAR